MHYFASQATLFAPLPKARTPWTQFFFSTLTQGAAVALLIWVRILYPSVVTAPEHTFRSVRLVDTPVPVNHQPQPVKPVITARLDPLNTPPVNALRLPASPKAPVKMDEPVAPTINMAPKQLEPLPVKSAPVIPKEAVKTNVFSTGSSATPTIAVALAPSKVQTGGFGDPNGIPAKPGQGKAVNIAALGSFDLPSGPGYGNGTGGAKGVAGVIASTGFGNGTALPAQKHVSTPAVQSGGFSDAASVAPTSHSHMADSVNNRALPAEILSKPNPIYTSEAKNLKIEGEVLLEAVLQASGSVRVLRVVRGLGHGLDDNAVKAAQQIRFKPATKDGQPTDSTVVLHITFQLA